MAKHSRLSAQPVRDADRLLHLHPHIQQPQPVVHPHHQQHQHQIDQQHFLRHHTTSRSVAAAAAATKRELLVCAATAVGYVWRPPPAAHASNKSSYSPAFLDAFKRALSTTGSFEEQDGAWSRVIALAPENTAAWSNRGTLRLQNQQWAAAYEDLSHAVALEHQQAGSASAVALNQLGNVEGALGRWGDAMQHYKEAAEDPEMGSIAGANYALAAWETGQDVLAVKLARSLLRRDPEFLDMRCALTAFLWGCGDRAAAEDSWEGLQQASDGLGAAMYNRSSAVERVRHRWPPRATAALVAFLALSDAGQAEGYDLVMHEYKFAKSSSAV